MPPDGASAPPISTSTGPFHRPAPAAPEVLDAERMDELLSVVNHRYAARSDVAPLERTELTELAAQADG
ncbi:MAG TPA: hypothetical protein VH877_32160 [Polyangia bacterium]|nr:hypothetical protein [Polyangia bacterium]